MAEILADAVKALTMTQKEFGKLLGVSQVRISQLIKEGIIPRDPVTKQPIFYEGLTNYLLSKNATGDDANFWKERSLHEKAKRELAELRLQRERGELYYASDVEAAITECMIIFRDKMLGLGHKLAPQLAGLPPAQICNRIDAEITEILKELAENVAHIGETAETAETEDGDEE